MRVRNFWIEIEVDGKKTKVACGPRSADGGFTMKVFQRSSGEVLKVATIQGTREGTQLVSRINLANDSDGGDRHLKFQTHR